MTLFRILLIICCVQFICCSTIENEISYEEMHNYSPDDKDYPHHAYFKSNKFLITADSSRILDKKIGKLIHKKHQSIYDNRANCIFLKINNKWGAIKDNYEIFIPFDNDTIGMFEDHPGIFNDSSLCLSMKNGFIGFYDLRGKLALPHQFKWASNKSIPHVIAKSKNRFSLLNLDGKELIPPIYDTIYPVIDKRNYFVQHKNKIGLVNIDNETVIKCENDSLEFFLYLYKDQSRKYYAHYNFLKNGKWGIIDGLGQTIISAISESKYELLARPEMKAKSKPVANKSKENIPEYYYSLKQNGKFGIINSFGEVIIRPKFDSILPYGYSYRDQIIKFSLKNDTVEIKYNRNGLKLELVK